jgi:hypothetical protein
MSSSRTGVTGLLTLAFALPSLAGDPLIDNLGEPTSSYSEIANASPLYIDQFAAQAFIPTDQYSLDLVQVILANGEPGSVPSFQLRTGETTPDALLATLVEQSFPTGPDQIVTLLPDQPVTLESGVKYWVVMEVAPGGFFQWAYALGNNWVGPGLFQEYSYSYDLGASWGTFGNINPFHMRVEVSPILPPACYPDCDGSLGLDVNDFICFQTFYAIGDLYADCDASGGLDIDDFICYQTLFALGC